MILAVSVGEESPREKNIKQICKSEITKNKSPADFGASPTLNRDQEDKKYSKSREIIDQFSYG